MRDTPHFWQMIAVGILAFLAELVILLGTIRGWRARTGGASSSKGAFALRTIVLAIVVALLLPSQVIGLVSGGQRAIVRLIVGPSPPWFEKMTSPWDQVQVLLLGTIVGLPSFMLAGITVGAVATSQCGSRVRRILFCSAAPTILMPFFLGVCFYLHRMLGSHYQPSAAKRAMDAGAWLAGFALAGFVAWLAYHLARTRGSAASWPKPRHNIVAGVAMLAMAAIVGWFSRPFAAENHSPPSGHDDRTSRMAPAIPPGITQRELYDFTDKTWMGHYRDPLAFPLVHQKEDAMFASGWGPLLRLSDQHLMIEKQWIETPQELREELRLAERKVSLLHPNEREGSTLIMAPPGLSLDLLADVLAVIYDRGGREVRLVTGVPETIQRPAVGPLTRIIWQTTAVAIARSGDLDPKRPQRSIPVPGRFQRYRELLDQVLESRRLSLPPVLMLDRKGSWHWSGWAK